MAKWPNSVMTVTILSELIFIWWPYLVSKQIYRKSMSSGPFLLATCHMKNISLTAVVVVRPFDALLTYPLVSHCLILLRSGYGEMQIYGIYMQTWISGLPHWTELNLGWSVLIPDWTNVEVENMFYTTWPTGLTWHRPPHQQNSNYHDCHQFPLPMTILIGTTLSLPFMPD